MVLRYIHALLHRIIVNKRGATDKVIYWQFIAEHCVGASLLTSNRMIVN